jgi:hypothetical protein
MNHHFSMLMAAGAACLVVLSGCSKEDMDADTRDVGWVNRSVAACPAVAASAKAGWTDGRFSIADLERFQGALVVARNSPVKGQDCAPKYLTPTSTRDVVVEDSPLITTTMTLMPDGRGGTIMMPQTQIIPQSHTILAEE